MDSKEEKLDNVLKGIDFGADYVLVYKDLDNVLDDIDFANDTERLLTQSIIRSLEEEASKQLPNTGTADANEALIAGLVSLGLASLALTLKQKKEDED